MENSESIDQKFKAYLDRRISECNCRNAQSENWAAVEMHQVSSEIAPNIFLGKASSDDMPNWNAAVGLLKGNHFSVYGGAVLLSDRVAISSQHLLNIGAAGIPDGLYLHVGAKSLDQGEKVKILDVWSSRILSDFDISLYVLDTAAGISRKCHSIRIVEEREFSALQEQNTCCLVAGFGYTSPRMAGSSKLLVDLAMRLGPYNAISGFPIPRLFRVRSCNGGGPCEKDSGSGLFVVGANGSPLLAGIASRLASGRFSCHTGGYPALYSNVSAIRADIERFVQAVG